MHSFNLNYAPHFNTFENLAGPDLLDQLRFMADTGFRAVEDSGPSLPNGPGKMGVGLFLQPTDVITKLGETMAALGMEMGTVSLGPVYWPPQPTLTSGNPEWRDHFLHRCRQMLELIKRLNGKYITISADMYDFTLPIDIQTANVIDGLRYACDIFEPAGVAMLLEPLSDAPQLFLRTAKQTHLICTAINRACCKILFDMYHLQKNEGRLIYHMDLFWDQIGYFQIGDEPGRFEPGTGEINYKNIFRHIYQKSKETNREFILGMEHYNAQPGKEGELAVLEAYKWHDNF